MKGGESHTGSAPDCAGGSKLTVALVTAAADDASAGAAAEPGEADADVFPDFTAATVASGLTVPSPAMCLRLDPVTPPPSFVPSLSCLRSGSSGAGRFAASGSAVLVEGNAGHITSE